MADSDRSSEDLKVTTIVVGDDDLAILEATARLLRMAGYEVVDVQEGVEVEARIREIKPDLALIDVDFGVVDGRDVCRSLRADSSMGDTFLVLVSATAVATDDQVAGLELGADGYIARPIANRELLARVNAFIRIREAERVRRLAEQAVYQAHRLSALGALADGVGHEISNPLMGIMGYAQLLVAQTDPDSKLHEYAEGIVRGGRRIAVVVDAVRALTRAGPRGDMGTLEISRFVESTIEFFSTGFGEKYGIAIELDFSSELPEVQMNSVEARNVLVALLMHARRALELRCPDRSDPKRIRISGEVAPDSDSIRVIVECNSDGIDPQSLPRVFEPFFTTLNRDEDNGLSLAVAYQIARNHGGDLSVESSVGEYTRFLLEFPIKQG